MKRVIDVSSWQPNIDWNKVKASGKLDAVMLRAGYGRNNIDAQFHRNAKELTRLGIPFGVYWFSYAYTVDMARQEAKYCLAAVKNYRLTYPICFDLEYDTINYAAKNGVVVGKTLATQMANAFCQEIQKSGYKPMNYTNLDYYRNKFGSVPYDMWYAQYGVNNPSVSGMAMWQYSSSGSVSGIPGKVDMNYCYKDYETGSVQTQENQTSSIQKDIVKAGQVHANNVCGAGLEIDGFRGVETKKAGIKVLQVCVNEDSGRKILEEDGIIGPKTQNAIKGIVLRKGNKKYMVTAAEVLLMLKGYNPNGVEWPGSFGEGLEAAVKQYQKDKGLSVDGLIGYQTFTSLIS